MKRIVKEITAKDIASGYLWEGERVSVTVDRDGIVRAVSMVDGRQLPSADVIWEGCKLGPRLVRSNPSRC